MKRYVVGFMFSGDGLDVCLILKNRPEWQAGKFNGVGGKIEPTDQSSAAAMCREFFEETGVNTDECEWDNFLLMRCDKESKIPGNTNPFEIYFFRAFSTKIWNVGTTTDEMISIVLADDLPGNVVPNLKWLVPMARNRNMLYGEVTVK
jgi:8-oxo-dGTP diphosphatase